MKNLFIHFSLIFFFSLGLFTSCQKENLGEIKNSIKSSDVELVAANDRGTCGLKDVKIDDCCVSFTVYENEGLGFTIDFGDNTIIQRGSHSDEVFSHCYSSPGKYKIVLTYYDSNGKAVCGSGTTIEIDESCVSDCCEVVSQKIRWTSFGPRFIVNVEGNAGDTVIITVGSSQYIFTISSDCTIQQFNVPVKAKQCSVKITVKIRRAGTGEVCDSTTKYYSLCGSPVKPIDG